ncbi:TetR family transcriptional regulator [Kitasatospora acidiphila]|uniref:TetR family transcriptional regulator n=1 Tax=Kitasatospora acidiphila TaxID=2567942 RepID=UPI001E3C3053|nr:TetR family transcriptional regulator [Kitasatospora acidiphila]
MPRAGLNPDAVVDHALALIDEDGPDALTLAAVAARAGVAAPRSTSTCRADWPDCAA